MNPTSSNPTVAYFSMEIALDRAVPTYSGGLGVLAGDTLRSFADLALPVVGITLLHRKGYFEQHLDQTGNQTEAPVAWKPEELLEAVDVRTSVQIEGRTVHIRAWKYAVKGHSGHELPVYLLDTQLDENDPVDRGLTDYLYGGDNHYRLCQEVVLGMGGAALLKALGCSVQLYPLKEGLPALLTLALLDCRRGGRKLFERNGGDIEGVRRAGVSPTPTRVPAGHDRFPIDMVRTVLGANQVAVLEA